MRLILLVLLLAPLMGCAGLYGDVCPDIAPSAADEPKERNCTDDFLSARKQRSILYSGNDTSRIYTGEEPRNGPLVDASRVNAPPARPVPIVAYVGNLRIDYPVDEAAISTDVGNLRAAGAKRFDPNQRVTVDFNRATIDYVLRQLLGGALGVNYIAPEGLGGSITFRSEEPIPKSQILQVVRDILARNQLVMKYINGIYHIGRADLIATLDATSLTGQVNEMVTRIVRLERGNGMDIATVARQLLPETVTLLPSNLANTIIVRAPAVDVDRVEETLKTLSSAAMGNDRVAVIPLRQGSPERIAIQLSDFYRSRMPQQGLSGGERGGAAAAAAVGDLPTIIPLEKQQALLVGAKDAATLAGIRRLVQEMDRDNSDEPALRLIPLQHLAAEELAPRLASILATGTSEGQRGAAGNRQGQGANQGANQGPNLPPLFPPGQLSAPRTPLADDDTGTEAAPGFSLPGGVAPRGTGPSGRQQNQASTAGRTPPAASGSGVKIVADVSTNTLMVYSTFALFRRLRDVVQALDVPQSQIVIEAMIVEVELNDQLDHGVQMFLQGPNVAVRSTGDAFPDPTAGVQSPPGRGGAFVAANARFGQYRADVVLSALQEITKVKVISSPYLTVADGKTAKLVVGDQIPYTVRSQTSQNTGNVTVTQETEIKDTGIILDVTPRIYSDNSVSLKISQQVSTPSPSAQAGNTTPVISTRNVESNVITQSGRTILLAGLIQDKIEAHESGVPVLRSAPVVGDLFKTREDRVRRVELLIMITPRVIRHTTQIEDITRLLRSQLHTR